MRRGSRHPAVNDQQGDKRNHDMYKYSSERTALVATVLGTVIGWGYFIAMVARSYAAYTVV